MAVKVVTEQDFGEVVLSSSKPVLVDFWAEWCGPCKAFAPVYDEFSEEVGEAAVIAKMNVDQQTAVARKYKVMSIPTLILFKDGEIVDRHVGGTDIASLHALLEKAK